MNSFVFNSTADQLRASMYGYDPVQDDCKPVQVDNSGNLLVTASCTAVNPYGKQVPLRTDWDGNLRVSATDTLTVNSAKTPFGAFTALRTDYDGNLCVTNSNLAFNPHNTPVPLRTDYQGSLFIAAAYPLSVQVFAHNQYYNRPINLMTDSFGQLLVSATIARSPSGQPDILRTDWDGNLRVSAADTLTVKSAKTPFGAFTALKTDYDGNLLVSACFMARNPFDRPVPLRTDWDGSLLITASHPLSVAVTSPITISGLSISNLTIDNPITISNASLTVNMSSGFTSNTASVVDVSGRGSIFSYTDISAIRTASLFINNFGSAPITVSLQLSPDGYNYFDDPSYTDKYIAPRKKAVLAVDTFAHYFRLAYSLNQTASFAAYYNGQE